MQSQRSIKRKIRAVNNIKKITRAMQLVSAAKLRKFQEKLTAIRSYLSDLKEITRTVLRAAVPEVSSSPFLAGYSPGAERELYIILSAEKGLCGSFNANIIRYLPRRVEDITHPWVIAVGRKMIEAAKRQRMSVLHTFPQFLSDPSSGGSNATRLDSVLDSRFLLDTASAPLETILAAVLDSYHQLKPRKVWVVYTAFVNPVVYRVASYPFLPLPASALILPFSSSPHAPAPSGAGRDLPPSQEKERTGISPKRKSGAEQTFYEAAQTDLGDVQKEWYFEPTPGQMFEPVLHHYLYTIFHWLFLESLTSEHASRMMAMRNATDNAQELVEDLTLQYNKARQASITKELLDIVGTAEALR